jgi:hypothetical protein
MSSVFDAPQAKGPERPSEGQSESLSAQIMHGLERWNPGTGFGAEHMAAGAAEEKAGTIPASNIERSSSGEPQAINFLAAGNETTNVGLDSLNNAEQRENTMAL